MNWDMWKKYLLLMTAVVLCAGAVWYFAESGERPQGDAVLAFVQPGGIAEADSRQEHEKMMHAFAQSGRITGGKNKQEHEAMVHAFAQSGGITAATLEHEEVKPASAYMHAEYREVQDI